ncbi:ParB N-terminal domain-containing protein [Tropicimonas sp. TH_r6]|uniref:ParB/RepB/Spo0J family partition protein n=1 Tax=Tropicimonas sp. TH_r6 TaxID=3082085 RepID=UPI002955D935|nr:ParB N-terminal domain-containing protein [Tropicimonas sp. TH_r6]MDV7145545.1 ParB N-terminal domain-containing protein [Tropicimonas sp. TH_r6]
MARRRRLTPVVAHLPEEAGTDAGAARTRAPIAAAAGDAAAGAALAEVAGALEAARAEGRLAQPLPLEAVIDDHLERDRYAARAGNTAKGRLAAGGSEADEDMAALMESLSTRGQQVPIEVVALGDGRFGLISGWRRLTALRTLNAQTGEERFATVLAVLRQPETAAEAYVSMVEENEIRQGLSHYERARIAVQAVARGAFPDLRSALRGLYATASRAKRSKIGSFAAIVTALDDSLRFPTALPERLGLELSKSLEEEEALASRLSSALASAQSDTAEAEQSLIRSVLAKRAGEASPEQRSPPAPKSGEDEEIHLIGKPGRITLTGPGVTREFRAALTAWVKARQDS